MHLRASRPILRITVYMQYNPMPRLPRKTAVLTVRIAPEVKAALEEAAASERRSLANMLEVMVLAYCNEHAGTPPERARTKPEKKVR